MRALLILTGVGLTVGTFVAAERLQTSSAQSLAVEQQAALDEKLKQSNTNFATQFAALKSEKDEALSQVAKLSSTVADVSSTRDTLAAQVSEAQSKKDDFRRRVSALEMAKSALVATLKEKDAMLSTHDAELAALNAQIAELSEEIGPSPDIEAENAALSAQVASLNEELASRDAAISTLQEQIDTAEETAATTIPQDAIDEAVAEELAAAQAKIEELSTASEANLASLNETLAEREATVAALQAELDALATAAPAEATTDAAAPSEDVAALSAQLLDLNELVASQTKTISTLRMGLEEDMEMAEMASACIERANKIFELSQIKFATGTSSISEDSVTTLDHLRDLAIGCESKEMYIEIGGHTDSLGAEASNQKLSEARAQSVRDFLIGRGIPEDTMIAVGFGETQPIASNDTQVGRAQNRRITFTWQMREKPAEEAAVQDTATPTENIDG